MPNEIIIDPNTGLTIDPTPPPPDPNIQVELKAKHYYLVAEILFSTAAYESFSTLNTIAAACAGAADDDLVILPITPQRVFYVYSILTYKPEGQFNRVNTEMYDLLLPQIQAGYIAGDEKWMWLGSQISATRDQNLSVVNQMIANGKSKLYS